MNIEQFRNFCLSLENVKEKIPFDDKLLVFFVRDKIFYMTNMDTFEHITVKCSPEVVIQLREKYEEVVGGYTMNKKHWISVKTNGKINDMQFQKWIKDSYDLVTFKSSKKIKQHIAIQNKKI